MPKIFKENKIIVGIVMAIFGLVVSWGIWVTNGTYKSENTAQSLSNDINAVKESQTNMSGEIKEIRNELKEQRDLIHTNQEKILERLGGISKSLKRQSDGR